MKKLLSQLSVLSLCAIVLSCSQSKKPTNGFHVKGITSLNTQTAYLKNNHHKIIDSATVTGHKFSFYGIVEAPSFYTITLKNQTQQVEFILENSDIEISITPNNHIAIGGNLQERFATYKNKKKRLQLVKLNYLEHNIINPSKQLQHKTDSINILLDKLLIHCIKANKENDIATYIFKNDIKKTASTQLLSTLESISKTSKNTVLIALIDAQILAVTKLEEKKSIEAAIKRTAVKKTKRRSAPMFSGENLLGGDLSLQTVLKGKKAVLIDFWASWCGPCRQITPIVKNLHTKYKNKGFTVLTVSEDKTRDAWRNGIATDGMSEWNHIFDDYMRIAYMFNVGSIPHMVLIDGNGGIVKNKISINDLEREILKLIN